MENRVYFAGAWRKPNVFCFDCSASSYLRPGQIHRAPEYRCQECRTKKNREDSLLELTCFQCSSTFTRRRWDVNNSKRKEGAKSDRVFCNSSCAASYNNIHKKYGIRRSKLEKYLEGVIREEFPYLELVINDREQIGYELDFFLPELRLGIEINGIFHYEPIFGEEKLERIQNNDKKTRLLCEQNNIELIVGASLEGYLKPSVKEKYKIQLLEILNSVIKRKQNAPLA